MNSKVDIEKAVNKTAKKIREDFDSKRPSVPAEIVFAYQDNKVKQAIRNRLEAGEVVESVKALLPDVVTRYRRVFIAFASPGFAGAATDGILVQVNESNQVVEVIEPFKFTETAKRLVEERDGVFSLRYSTPLQRNGVGTAQLNKRFEKFVKDEGIDIAFTRLRGTFGGGFYNFESGTCVITTYRIPTIRPTGSPDPFPGSEGIDADEQEDDTTSFF